MNRVVRGTMAFMLVGLVLVILTGAAYAQTWQEAYPVESYGPNQIVLEKYSVAVASVQNWDKTNPVEYYGAYQMAMAQYNPALMAEQGWDSTHTVEYYSALQTAPAAPMIVESSDSSCYILRSGCGSRPAAPMIVESSDGATQMAMAQYNPALMGEQGWDSTHTVEYYGANQIAMEQQNIAQAHSPNLSYDNQIPQELVGMQEFAAYESILIGGPSVPNTVNFETFETAMWAYDNGIPQELFGLQEVAAYESKLQGQPVEAIGTLAQDQTDQTLDSVAIEGDTPCGQC